MVTVLINYQLPVLSHKDLFWGHSYFFCMLMICHILFLEKKIKLFADDTNLFISASTVSELELKANFHIQNINQWLIANKLHLNIEKTCYSIFSANKSFLSTLSLKINNSVINRVNNCKYLGVIIDDQLKWSIHIESVEQKLNRVIGILYKK